jgi:hypothetical protein
MIAKKRQKKVRLKKDEIRKVAKKPAAEETSSKTEINGYLILNLSGIPELI